MTIQPGSTIPDMAIAVAGAGAEPRTLVVEPPR